MKPAVLVCSEPIQPCMGGIGIRYLEFARRLSERGLDILLFTPGDPEDVPEISIPRSRIRHYEFNGLAQQVADSGCVVAQGQAATELVASDISQPLVIDLYDPFLIENMYYVPEIGTNQYHSDLASWRTQMSRGDFFLCASEAQRLYYLGFLTALGRVDPSWITSDPEYRTLIDLVPYGTEIPPSCRESVLPPRKTKEKRILLCGMYDWYDPWPLLNQLEQMGGISCTLIFMKYPNPEVTPQGILRAIMDWAEAKKDGVFKVEFHDWVPAARRFDLFRDVDVMVVPHGLSIETQLSLRTRMIDALAAGCPVVASSSGTLSDLIAKENAGWVVPTRDGHGMVKAIDEVLRGGADVDLRIRRGQSIASAQFNWDLVLKPLLRFCQNPQRDTSMSHIARASDLQASSSQETNSEHAFMPDKASGIRPKYSVIIPTYNRNHKLEEVLHALKNQKHAPPFEVIVVDDGSKVPVSRTTHPDSYPGLRLKIIRQDNSGPAAARNHGVSIADGTMVAFLGDDTLPAPGWLAGHEQAQNGRSERVPLAVIGHIDWHPSIHQTAFLRYINEQGLQFGFKTIPDPENLTYHYFYASNISLPRILVEEEPFCTDFKAAAWEDTELGLRLQKKKNLQMVYAPEAVVYHKHKLSFSTFARRQYNVGKASSIFYRLHSEIGSMVGLTQNHPQPLPARTRVLWNTLVIRVCEYLNISLSNLWHETLRYHFIRGQHDVFRSRGR